MIFKRILSKTAFLAILSLGIIGCKDNYEKEEVKQLQVKVDSLSRVLESRKMQNDSLVQLQEKTGGRNGISVYFDRAFDTIDQPEVYIANALNEQREKIPIDAVLGGNMEFREIEVLSAEWVMAVYDDGHIQGKSIFKYELQPDGSIKFTELLSKLPNER
jgi:phosphopantetheine adenylyltransferase